jgi:hypothetical protein
MSPISHSVTASRLQNVPECCQPADAHAPQAGRQYALGEEVPTLGAGDAQYWTPYRAAPT